MNYNRYNGNKHFYIGGGMVKDTRILIVWGCLAY